MVDVGGGCGEVLGLLDCVAWRDVGCAWWEGWDRVSGYDGVLVSSLL